MIPSHGRRTKKILDGKFNELREEFRQGETVDPKRRGTPFNQDANLRRLLAEMENRIIDRISKLEGKQLRFGSGAGPG
jgi:hypothetical protein